ncbi:unnamed protein product [Toxocara canis]|uniref:protein-serine/threonine phosphatase n=1 Tax=Toxocara canis TaxID=6265 RepID=A0A3P7INE5_TOXCA|nr:unnamed protein product [Toxocara canis]
MLFILLLKLRWPEHVYMLRGKHETYEVNINDGFRTVCEKAFPKTGIFSRFNALFDCMPIAAIISDRILCCHGGVSCWMICRDNIRRIPRRSFVEKMKMLDCCLLADILWADLNPKQSRPFVPSERDVSYSFNEEGLDAVLGALQVCTLVRGHYHGQNGYVELLPTKCYAIGTATDPRNKDVTGAVLGIRRDISNQYHFQAILHKRANMKDLSYYCHHMLERLEDSFISDYDAPLGSLTCSQCNFITTQELQTSARVISHIEIVDWVLKNAHKQVLHDSAYRSLDTSNMHAFAQRLIHLFPLYYDLIHLPGGTFRVAVTDTEWSVIKKYHEGLELDRNPQSTALTNALIGASARKAETVDMTGVEKGGRSTVSGDAESGVESTPRNTKSASESIGRRQRTDKTAVKDEPELGTAEASDADKTLVFILQPSRHSLEPNLKRNF